LSKKIKFTWEHFTLLLELLSSFGVDEEAPGPGSLERLSRKIYNKNL
jgi:hypothetical protein